MLERSRLRDRPQPTAIVHALHHFQRIWVLDATTLEEVSKKVGLLQGVPETVLGGKLLAALNLPSKPPVQLWLDPDPKVNEKSFLDQVKAVLASGTLLAVDRGFYAFSFFDWLTEHGVSFVTRARTLAAFQVQKDYQTLIVTNGRRARPVPRLAASRHVEPGRQGVTLRSLASQPLRLLLRASRPRSRQAAPPTIAAAGLKDWHSSSLSWCFWHPVPWLCGRPFFW